MCLCTVSARILSCQPAAAHRLSPLFLVPRAKLFTRARTPGCSSLTFVGPKHPAVSNITPLEIAFTNTLLTSLATVHVRARCVTFLLLMVRRRILVIYCAARVYLSFVFI
jgi:hypothetical protein